MTKGSIARSNMINLKSDKNTLITYSKEVMAGARCSTRGEAGGSHELKT